MTQFLARLKRRFGYPRVTRSRWYADLRSLERLREILTDPVFVNATNLVLSERAMAESDIFNIPALIPLKAAFSAGHRAFLSDLEALARAPVQLQPEPEGWDHIDSPYAIPTE